MKYYVFLFDYPICNLFSRAKGDIKHPRVNRLYTRTWAAWCYCKGCPGVHLWERLETRTSISSTKHHYLQTLSQRTPERSINYPHFWNQPRDDQKFPDSGKSYWRQWPYDPLSSGEMCQEY